jgi:CRISPR-associated protein Csm5
MRDRHVLRAWPLTPIHVGTGEELTPESFVLQGDGLRSFNSFAALATASEKDRERYRQWLASGAFVKAQTELAKLGSSRGAFSGESIAVSPSTLSDLRNVLDGQSSGKAGIRPFMRDGDAPILPSSSLKGALRTAWIDQEISAKPTPDHIPTDIRDTSRKSRTVNDAALQIEPKALEQDPFRDLAVIDARIPLGRTRYDRATLGKRDRDTAKLNLGEMRGIQMHVERLIGLADGGKVEPFDIEIHIAGDAFVAQRARMGRRAGRRLVPEKPIGAAALWVAANRFHADLWRYERGRFYANSATAALLERLLAPFGLRDGDDLAGQLDAKGLVLLRVGRYGQFESKAVRLNDRRYGVKAATFSKTSGRKDAQLMDEGGTRTTAKVANDIDAPFGWLILALPGKGPAGAVSAALPAAPFPSRAAPAAPDSRLFAPVQFRFRKGDRVVNDDLGEEGVVARDVGMLDAKMDVDCGDGPEPLPIGGWRLK